MSTNADEKTGGGSTPQTLSPAPRGKEGWATDEMFRRIEGAIGEGYDRGASNKSIGSVVFNIILEAIAAAHKDPESTVQEERLLAGVRGPYWERKKHPYHTRRRSHD